MAVDGEEDNQHYESGPEEANMSLNMRRRVASDDDDEEEAIDDVTHHQNLRASYDDSDGQGGAAEYDDDEEGEEEDEVDGEEYSEREEQVAVDGLEEVNGGEVVTEVEKKAEGEGQEENKENAPFAVPISGAFYMHDDRFRDNTGARHRKTFGRRKLWESKDDRKWGHDKFEEMNMQERHYEKGRSFRGYYHGRGKGRGAGHGNVTRNRVTEFDGYNYQNLAPKKVRGRGPIRYQPSMKSKSETLPPQNGRSVMSNVKTLHNGFGRNAASSLHNGFGRNAASSAGHNVAHDAALAVKGASNLNHASPPFYPSGPSTLTQDKDQNFLVPFSNTMLQGKTVIDSMSMDKLHIDDSVSLACSKSVDNVHSSFPESSLCVAQMSTMLQLPQSHNRVKKVSRPASQAYQQHTVQNRAQASLQAPGQLPRNRSLAASLGSPPKGGVQGAGRGALMYSGAQVMGSSGNMGAGNGDQNLPAFFRVMQLEAQHPKGVGVPAVGMAFPGCVAQPNDAGNSEMTWLPILASAAGALGATYSPPYIPIDGAYHSRPTGTSALPAPSKDINYSRLDIEEKPEQRSEFSHYEVSQRQNKPRRYSEMNITQ